MSRRLLAVISTIILCIVCTAAAVCAAGDPMERFLPAPACAEGWVMEGKVTLYTKDTLFERINGESELYFPYGFELLASARYENRGDPQVAVEADVYRMGSLLDAFGMYANYLKADDPAVDVGAEAALSPSQLLFYQDRYFVRLQASGTLSLGQDVFSACARAISRNLPGSAKRPGELEAFMVPEVVKRSERYIPKSVLGYVFLRKGLTAEAAIDGEEVKVFAVSGDSPEDARRAFDQYRSYLGERGRDITVTETAGRLSLAATDPLYGGVFVEQEGRYLVGAVRVKGTSGAKRLVEQLRNRLAGRTE